MRYANGHLLFTGLPHGPFAPDGSGLTSSLPTFPEWNEGVRQTPWLVAKAQPRIPSCK